MGHIRDLPKDELGIDIKNGFKPKYVLSPDKIKTIKNLQETARKSNKIYLASDHDREGEAIAFHLQFILKKYKKNGGRIYTIGSTPELQKLADIRSPADMFSKLQKKSVRKKLRKKVHQLEGDPLISIKGVNYVAANIVRKKDRDQYVIHFVNYSRPLKNVRIIR